MYDHEHEAESIDFTQPLDIAEPQRPPAGDNEATLVAFKSRRQEPKYAPGTEVTVFLAEFKFVWENDEGVPCEAIETKWIDIKDPKRGREDAQFLAVLTNGDVVGSTIKPTVDPRNRINEIFVIKVGHHKSDAAKWYMNGIKNLD